MILSFKQPSYKNIWKFDVIARFKVDEFPSYRKRKVTLTNKFRIWNIDQSAAKIIVIDTRTLNRICKYSFISIDIFIVSYVIYW